MREMFLSEYDEATTLRRLREEAIREGYDDGYDKGYDKGRRSILEHLRDKVNAGSMSVQDALDFGFSEQELHDEVNQ